MPRNKNAIARIKIIDNCLQRPGIMWSWERIAQECWEKMESFIDDPPSRETILGDIKFMRQSWSAPIIYDRNKKSYSYSDPHYSVFNHPLTREDIDSLQFALEVIRQFKGFRKLEGIEDIITKLQHMIQMVEPQDHPTVQFEHSLNEMGLRWLDVLFGYIINKSVVRISYKPFKEDPRTIIVSPYLLKEYNNRWFLLGLDHSMHKLQIYSLDRIHHADKFLERFIPNTVLDPKTYFNDLIGVTRYEGRRRLKIQFQVEKNASPYIRTKPIHESQELLQETDEYDLYNITVIPNVELESRFLSYGNWLTVVSPPGFVNQMYTRVESMVKNYQSTRE
ncbi:MAG: WYL domain-containing protein [Saprospiraceae bacterium]|nr:WYL domain-containing protein [Saprospiraceae bacterium]